MMIEVIRHNNGRETAGKFAYKSANECIYESTSVFINKAILKISALVACFVLLFTFTGCGNNIRLGDEVTKVEGVRGDDGNILYFTRVDYSEISSSNPELERAVGAYMDEVLEEFYEQDENLAIAQEDYDGWDDEIDGRKFPTATEDEFENEEAEGVFYDVFRIIVTSKRAPYISLRSNRITYSSKNNIGATTLTATFDAKTAERLELDDILTKEQQANLNEKIKEKLQKEHKDELKDDFEKKIPSYKEGPNARWYIDGKDFVVMYDESTVCSMMAGNVEVRIRKPW